MRVLDLPRRRYSVPETIMRKYRLRQRAESNSSSSSEECRRRRCVDKSIQTSPRESIGRTSSLPFLATPSPCVWSYTTSDCQTVSDRTTSTQDSTLSVPSTTPESYATLFRTEEAGTQVSFPDRTDRTTSVTGLQTDRTEETVLDIAVSIETDISDDTIVEANRRKGESPIEKEETVNTSYQTGNHALFKVPEINVFKDSSESQSGDKPLEMKEQCSQVTGTEITEEMRPIQFRDRPRTDMACTGSNYDKFPVDNPVIPRYSAIPRTNSMIVNTSSIEYSSDSELSLTDSLEDPDEFRTPRLRKQSKHDQRMVRGEVTMEQESKRLPKSRDAYAYFLSLTGEEEIIREYTIPEWLRNRLRKREKEIKKEYEDKMIRHQQHAHYRRRKKTIRRVHRINLYSSDEKSNRNETHVAGSNTNHGKMAIFQECPNNNNISKNNLNPGPSNKNASIRLLNGNNMGFEPKIDNIQRNKFNNNHCNNNNDNIDREQSQRFKQTEPNNSSNANPNLVQISEVIKIEMSDNLRTIITKEKQINLSSEMNLKKIPSDSNKEGLPDASKSIITKNSEKSYKTEPTGVNILQATSEIETKGNPESLTTKHKIDLVEQERKSPNVEKGYLRVPEVKKESSASNFDKTENDWVTEPAKAATSTTVQDGISHSKIELDRSIADILITALEENTRARQKSIRTSETITLSEEGVGGQLKTFVDQGSQKNENEVEPLNICSHGVQTDGILYNKEEGTENINRSDISCNTEPYLVSVCVQTSDPDDQGDSDNSASETYEVETMVGSFDDVECLEDVPIIDDSTNMVDKACNTVESVSISTQTNVSILQSDDIVNRVNKEKSNKKKDVQFPPQVIKQIITGTGEYMTVDIQNRGKSKDGIQKRTRERKGKINKGTNTDEPESVTENNKNINNCNTDIVFNRTAQTPHCKNTFSSKSHKKKSQVLELNVPICTCHMCTLQRISPRGEQSKSKIPQSKKNTDFREGHKQAQKFVTRRSNVTGQIQKFRLFEAIPEEKNSSAESISEDGINQEKSTSATEKHEKGVLTEPHLVDQIIQVSSNNVNAATNTEPNIVSLNRTAEATQTSEQPKRKSNLVIGRFRSENRDSPTLVRQYKGRASLSAGHIEGQEELLTLSKGWINFYLLRDNLEFSDSNGEEGSMCQNQLTETRRRIQTVEKGEDKIEEYTVEIHATPEPESKSIGRGRVTLPEINTSSSSSTPERDKKKTSIPAVDTLPGVKKSKRTKRSQINLTREAITKLGTCKRGEKEKISSRAVEVACSEQSISSITSSTVILSESPPPQQLKLPERRSHHRHRIHKSLAHHVHNGSNWTVTVAGSSGSGNDPPPDVEMKLTFGKQGRKQENGMQPYQFIRTKRQDPMIEDFAHTSRNEEHNQLQYTLRNNQHPKSSFERTRGGTARDNFSYEEDYINRLSSRRSKYSTEDGSETTGDLHVTGLAITPEKKPRVPTQSERDILRPQRYKFTR